MRVAEEKGMTEKKYRKVVGDILARPEHQWYQKGFGEAVMKSIKEQEKSRYKQ